MAKKLRPLDDKLVDLVTFTANEIRKAHGWFTTVKKEEVRTVLEAIRLVNILMERKKNE